MPSRSSRLLGIKDSFHGRYSCIPRVREEHGDPGASAQPPGDHRHSQQRRTQRRDVLLATLVHGITKGLRQQAGQGRATEGRHDALQGDPESVIDKMPFQASRGTRSVRDRGYPSPDLHTSAVVPKLESCEDLSNTHFRASSKRRSGKGTSAARRA